eukprot:scaffold192087_cov19-Tisochrysis_lutea.AAC.1
MVAPEGATYGWRRAVSAGGCVHCVGAPEGVAMDQGTMSVLLPCVFCGEGKRQFCIQRHGNGVITLPSWDLRVQKYRGIESAFLAP